MLKFRNNYMEVGKSHIKCPIYEKKIFLARTLVLLNVDEKKNRKTKWRKTLMKILKYTLIFSVKYFSIIISANFLTPTFIIIILLLLLL